MTAPVSDRTRRAFERRVTELEAAARLFVRDGAVDSRQLVRAGILVAAAAARANGWADATVRAIETVAVIAAGWLRAAADRRPT